MPFILAFIILVLMVFIPVARRASIQVLDGFRKAPSVIPGRGPGREAFESIMESRGYLTPKSSGDYIFKRDTALLLVLNKIASTVESKVMFLSERNIVVGYQDEILEGENLSHTLIAITPSKTILFLE